MIMPSKRPLRSMLHLQMGQEVLYLLMTVGIMTSLILLVYTRSLQQVPVAETDVRALQQRVADLYTQLEAERQKTNSTLPALQQRVADLYAQLEAERQKTNSTLPDEQPPIITLSEARGYYFRSGSAALSEAFRIALLETIVPRILEISTRYNADVLEVVGHTDEVPISNRRSDIDRTLLRFLNREPLAAPVASDNVGLGMARAAAVVRELRADPRLKNLTILPLSAGQTTTVRDQLSAGIDGVGQDEERRRIEIRVRREFGS
jgi:alkylation response protein AidB-like acyl-CoA dehydrogenase